MQTTLEEQTVIIRDSPEHEEYLKFQHGRTKDRVNSFESKLAISSRVLLIIYVIYTTVRATVTPALPQDQPIIQYSLLVVDAIMLVLQSLGLEGSRPGLIHLAKEMEDQNKMKEAEKLRKTSDMVQNLMGATAVDIVLNAILTGVVAANPTFGIGPATIVMVLTVFIKGYSYGLLIWRVWAVGKYLGDMANLSHKGPKVISKHEAAKQAQEQEQKQIRIDNGNIMAVFQQAIEDWSRKQPDANAAFSESIHRLESIVSQKIDSTQQMQNAKIESMSRLIESLQFGSNSANSIASVEAILPEVESMLSRSIKELSQGVESSMLELRRQVNQIESITSAQVKNIQAKVDKAALEATASRIEAAKASQQSGKSTSEHKAASQEDSSNIIPWDRDSDRGLTKEEVIKLIESNEALANLSDSALASKVGATKSTANRAKREWFSTHPESLQRRDAGEIEAVNL